MADFHTHITTSTIVGITGALAANAFYDVPLPYCALAGGLCSVSGMLPDLDSDSGIPLRESIAFAAAIIPMLLVERFAKLGLSLEAMVLAAAAIYLLVRFGFAHLLKRFTVHRGMFHSIPAALIFAQFTFLIYDNEEIGLRFFMAGAALAGFLTHLILDELWSINFNFGFVQLKNSFGTALKLWSNSAAANVTTYAQLILLTFLLTRDPGWINVVQPWMNNDPGWAQKANRFRERLATWREHFFRNQYGGIPESAADYPWNATQPQADSVSAFVASPPPPLPSRHIVPPVDNSPAPSAVIWPAPSGQPMVGAPHSANQGGSFTSAPSSWPMPSHAQEPFPQATVSQFAQQDVILPPNPQQRFSAPHIPPQHAAPQYSPLQPFEAFQAGLENRFIDPTTNPPSSSPHSVRSPNTNSHHTTLPNATSPYATPHGAAHAQNSGPIDPVASTPHDLGISFESWPTLGQPLQSTRDAIIPSANLPSEKRFYSPAASEARMREPERGVSRIPAR